MQKLFKLSKSRSNLTILTNSIVKKINFSNKKAISVTCDLQSFLGKEEKVIKASKEIIICAGAINTPQLLQISGIGPKILLDKFGINTVIDQPNVGKHLQDHVGVNYYYKSKIPTLNQVLGSWLEEFLQL